MSWGRNTMTWAIGGNMFKNNDYLELNIQMFAEETQNDGQATDNSSQENKGGEQTPPTFTELLKNPEYQREFDKLVGKSLETAKTNWTKDYEAKLQEQKTEAEKLAKMNAEQKIQYELEKEQKLRADLEKKLNAVELYKTASGIAKDKDLPIGYLDLIDFSTETAETISGKIDTIIELRNKDMEAYLNSKLKESSPKQKKEQPKYDPYIEGFKSEY